MIFVAITPLIFVAIRESVNMSDDFCASKKKNLRKCTNLQLLADTRRCFNKEREINAEMIEYLAEIERRKCYLEYGCSSLYVFCTKELGYSGGAAYRRVDAVKLALRIPELPEKITTGALNLTSISRVATLLREDTRTGRDERKDHEIQKLLEVVEDAKDSYEIDKKLAPYHLGKKHRHDHVHRVDESTVRLALDISNDTMEMLKRAREVTSNQGKHISLAEVLHRMAKEYLEKHDPMLVAKRAEVRKLKKADKENAESKIIEDDFINNAQSIAAENSLIDSAQSLTIEDGLINNAQSVATEGPLDKIENLHNDSNEEMHSDTTVVLQGIIPDNNLNEEMHSDTTAVLCCAIPGDEIKCAEDAKLAADREEVAETTQPITDITKKRTRTIPKTIRNEVYLRDEGRCTHHDPKINEQCTSTYRLHIHHIKPFAQGGEHTIENLTLHCASHNNFMKEKDFPNISHNNFVQ